MNEYHIKCNKKMDICKKIKPITPDDIKTEFLLLKEYIGKECSDRCRIGNNIVDYFTFYERLHTKGKYNVDFYEFVDRIEEFKQKKFIRNMLHYYETVKNKNNTKNQYVVYKEVYNICISAINIFRPLVAMDVYYRFKPKCVLDPCAGWGGRLIGAAALNVPKYVGFEINKQLENPYKEMCDFLSNSCNKNTTSKMEIEMFFEDVITTQNLPQFYDMVFTSPPYYFLEKYPGNKEYKNKQDMNEHFYRPMIERTFQGLLSEGHFILNINQEIYNNVCIEILGEASEKIPLKKSKRQNDYTEFLYVWTKH